VCEISSSVPFLFSSVLLDVSLSPSLCFFPSLVQLPPRRTEGRKEFVEAPSLSFSVEEGGRNQGKKDRKKCVDRHSMELNKRRTKERRHLMSAKRLLRVFHFLPDCQTGKSRRDGKNEKKTKIGWMLSELTVRKFK